MRNVYEGSRLQGEARSSRDLNPAGRQCRFHRPPSEQQARRWRCTCPGELIFTWVFFDAAHVSAPASLQGRSCTAICRVAHPGDYERVCSRRARDKRCPEISAAKLIAGGGMSAVAGTRVAMRHAAELQTPGKAPSGRLESPCRPGGCFRTAPTTKAQPTATVTLNRHGQLGPAGITSYQADPGPRRAAAAPPQALLLRHSKIAAVVRGDWSPQPRVTQSHSTLIPINDI